MQWYVPEDGAVRVEVVPRQCGTFAGVEGYVGDAETGVTAEHDEWGPA